MAEYIKRQDVIDPFLVGKNTFAGFCTIEQAIENIESVEAADVVEVVRCKDCAVPHNKWLGCPNLNGLIPPPDFYCAKGERKDAKMDGKGEGE